MRPAERSHMSDASAATRPSEAPQELRRYTESKADHSALEFKQKNLFEEDFSGRGSSGKTANYY